MFIKDLIKYIKDNCIYTKEQGHKLYTHNGSSMAWAFDLRKAMLNPHILNQFAVEFLKAHEGEKYQLAAVETSGIPLMTAIMQKAWERGKEINGLIVRKKRKKHLQQALIDGEPNNLPVIIVDDSMNSGSSVINAAVKLRDAGCKIKHAFVLLNFQSAHGVKATIENKLLIKSLFNLDDFNFNYPHEHVPNTKYSVQWTFAAPKPNLHFAVCKSTPVIHNGSILFGSDSGMFWCLEANTGRLRWCHDTQDTTGKGTVSWPIVVDGLVYFGAYSGRLTCIHADSGTVIFDHKVCDWIGSSPCYAHGNIYIGLEYKDKERPGSVACFNAHTGEKKWEYFVGIQQHSSPVYAEETGYIVTGTNDGRILVLYPDDGRIRAELKIGAAVKYHPAVKGNLIVFGAFDGKLYVWDFVNNYILYTYQTNDLIYTRPLIVGDRVFCGSSDDQLIVMDLATKSTVAALDMGEKIHSSPSIIDGIVYFGTSKGEVIGLDPDTLSIMYRYQFPERMTNAVVSNGEMLFVHTFDNKLWAITHG
jgi:outer membrane protein assembly factor BamB/adenine/guanine phosphoribosyltransferase-like PRPP-binding protein